MTALHFPLRGRQASASKLMILTGFVPKIATIVITVHVFVPKNNILLLLLDEDLDFRLPPARNICACQEYLLYRLRAS